MTPAQYAKQEITNGRFPMMVVQPGEHGTFWLHDGDFRMLDGRCFTSREAAEKLRSKIIQTATNKYAA